MTDRTLNGHITEALALKAKIKALQEKLDSHTDKIKDAMTDRGITEYTHKDSKISYKAITSKRFDTTAFKKENPELAAEYIKESTAMRFTMA